MTTLPPIRHLALAAACLALAAGAHAAETTKVAAAPLSAAASDPAALKWMVGAPPPADKIIRFDDGSYFNFPQLRWSVSHFRQLMPTVDVARGLKAPVPLKRALRSDIDSLRFTPLGAKDAMTWEQSLGANYTDGIVVLHRGRIVYERYLGVLKESGQHGAMSVTKSVMGTIGAALVAEGKLDPAKKVAE